MSAADAQEGQIGEPKMESDQQAAAVPMEQDVPAVTLAPSAQDTNAPREQPATATPGVQVVSVPLSAFVKPEKPKKAASAYWIFACHVREEVTKVVKEKSGGKTRLPDVAQETGTRWKALSDEERKVFEDKAAADKERYQTEMQAYADACDPAAAARRKHGHLIPKQPPSPFSIYCERQRDDVTSLLQAEGKDSSAREVQTKLSEMWKVASEEEKNDCMQEHTKLKLEYMEKKQAWEATPEHAELVQAEKLGEEMQKAVQTAMAVEKAAIKEKAARDEKKRKREEEAAKAASKKARSVEKVTPQKSAPLKATPTPRSGKKSTKASPAAQAPEPDIPKTVLSEATKLGMEASLRNLMSRPEIMTSKKSARAVLDALQASNGLVNPAKRALLG